MPWLRNTRKNQKRKRKNEKAKNNDAATFIPNGQLWGRRCTREVLAKYSRSTHEVFTVYSRFTREFVHSSTFMYPQICTQVRREKDPG